MLTLLETQRAFRDAVLGRGDIAEDGHVIAEMISENGIPAPERLQIYRNNTFILLTDALSETFRVTHKLVGCDFFEAMAKVFIGENPPHSPSLIGYGATFADFIDDFEPAESLPYLGDVARLERAWSEAYHAADAQALDPQTLSLVPPERMGDITFRLHPSARFLTSPFPLVAIWEANQDGTEDDRVVSLDEGPTQILIVRPTMDVEMRSLSPAAFAFFRSLDNGLTVSQSLEQAGAIDTAFNLEVILGLAISDGTLTDAFFEGASLSHST